MDKIKVMYVITALNIGGAEINLYRLLGSIDRNSFDIAVISMMNKGAIGEMIEEDLGIPVFCLHMNNGLKRLTGFFRLGRIIKRWSPQVVHSHMVHANLLSRLVRIFYSYPVLICTIHNIDEKGRRSSSRWRLMAYRFSDFLCDLSTQVSQAGLKKYIDIKAAQAEKIIYMPNGIDLESFNSIKLKTNFLRQSLDLGNDFVFIAVGSLTEQKDYPNMLLAYSDVSKIKPETKLLIVGEGPLKEELIIIAKAIHINDKVLFLGLRSDVSALMQIADAFVMSSAWEGLPVVLLEAAASCLPIVATDVGGNSEVVLNQASGYLVPPNNTEALEKAMLDLINLSPEKREEMAQKGYANIEDKYSLEIIVSKWERLYYSLLEKKRVAL